MKYKIILILLIVIEISCVGRKPVKDMRLDYFEGIIHFDINYEKIKSSRSTYELSQLYGAKLVMTVKDGNTRKDYYSPEGKLLSTRIFSMSNHRSYSETVGDETILTYDPKISDYNCVVTKEGNEKLFGYDCVVIVVDGKPKSNFQNYPEIKTTYFVAKKLKLNPSWYSNFLDGGFNDVTKIGKGFYLKSIVEMGVFNKISNATKVEAKEVSLDVFKPNGTKAMKEI